jgi:hypothetical protein
MTDESSSFENKSSSWDFDHLHNEDECDKNKDFFSVLKKSVAKHVYLNDEERNSNENKIIDRSTIRIDSSDLISRCKNFLPLLTDANRQLFSQIKSGENVRIELDSDQDEEKTIEMNLMFCPNVDSSESDSDDEQIDLINQKNQVNIIEIQDDNNPQEIVNS